MGTLLPAFAGLLLVAVLLSSLAHRTILSTAALFLVAGFVLGDGVLGVVSITAEDEVVGTLAELALFAVLFTDGMRVGWADLRGAWRLPGRALGWGLPLTLVITALLAHYLIGLGWIESLLIGAVLAPTDPVFAAALVGNEKVPPRLRQLLNVESGVNDGLALPFVMVFLALAAGSHNLHLGELGLELGLGLLIGVAVPWLAIKLEQTRWFSASTAYEPLNALAIGLLVLALGKVTHGNLFLAAFAAGITVATFGQRQREAFEHFGELIAELFKLAALLVFGALITPALLGAVGWSGWLFAVLALVAARPIAIWISFLGSGLSMREQAAVAWFGPKGFASVVYGLIVLSSGIAAAGQEFQLIAVTIVLSILLHSSTDIVVARWFDDERDVPAWYGVARRLRDRVHGEPTS
ncbi:cation:proton antiporter [Planomonospora parontospora]|uniref:cation:proton antiporter n=1 Tax=Planomonospora parontospora TaxID=58119 RepID=UPI0016716540|nr:cation:proton antiporter [Planomonospora parontospora]GGL58948.1 peptidase [Planomonospora parontospora subsp. antibiotica]GII20249.1 peptidase [Planomonospora parontospora subsp. antibiotica]